MSVLIDNWPLITGMLLFFATIAILLIVPFKTEPLTGSGQRHQPVFSSTNSFLTLFLVVSLLIRLAYISEALFPSYFDSAQHYTLIKNILTNGLSQVYAMWGTEYYHLGFHVLAALLASTFQVEITTVMLVLGQIILALMPLPFFFTIKHLTRSNWAGMFAG
ncbi:MAG TPA: hypothetical protein VK851_09725, partial [Anaerolineales bacterium]|nr:hypothetical protein [Anaerolineales bacterium]